MTVLRQFYRQSVVRECRSGTMEPQTELLAHKEDKTMYELNKIAFGSFLAQLRGKGRDPGACRLPVCFG